MNSSGITPLNQLPELEDLERSNYRPQTDRPVEDDKFQKFLRNQHRPDMQAGMNPYSGLELPGSDFGSNPGPRQGFRQHSPGQGPGFGQGPVEMYNRPPMMSCLDIAGHVQNCPICSKFYSSDKTIYIIIIVVLAIMSLLLLKRVLNV